MRALDSPPMEAVETAPDVTFEAEDVTGSHTVTATFQSELQVGLVTKAPVSEMSLPTDVPWSLRNNRSSEFLKDDKAIGEQVQPGDRLTVTPKAHLG